MFGGAAYPWGCLGCFPFPSSHRLGRPRSRFPAPGTIPLEREPDYSGGAQGGWVVRRSMAHIPPALASKRAVGPAWAKCSASMTNTVHDNERTDPIVSCTAPSPASTVALASSMPDLQGTPSRRQRCIPNR